MLGVSGFAAMQELLCPFGHAFLDDPAISRAVPLIPDRILRGCCVKHREHAMRLYLPSSGKKPAFFSTDPCRTAARTSFAVGLLMRSRLNCRPGLSEYRLRASEFVRNRPAFQYLLNSPCQTGLPVRSLWQKTRFIPVDRLMETLPFSLQGRNTNPEKNSAQQQRIMAYR